MNFLFIDSSYPIFINMAIFSLVTHTHTHRPLSYHLYNRKKASRSCWAEKSPCEGETLVGLLCCESRFHQALTPHSLHSPHSQATERGHSLPSLSFLCLPKFNFNIEETEPHYFLAHLLYSFVIS